MTMIIEQIMMNVGVLFYALIFLGQAQHAVQNVYHKNACVWETFHASCDLGKVILIDQALYGRMYSSRCFNLSAAESSCYGDVHLFAEKQCGGRRSCDIKLTNENLKVVENNCSKYIEKFLEIVYRCEEVYSSANHSCVANRSLPVTASSGYLASIVTEETGKGSKSCPWSFDPRPGQTVHLTLLDFGVWVDRSERERRHICRIYAEIKHVGSSQQMVDTMVCRGDKRERSLMTTATAVKIGMTEQRNATEDIVYFLIKFQVFDCPDFEAPPGTIMEKSESGIRIVCSNDTQKFWEVRCIASRWEPRINVICPSSPDTSLISTTASACPQFNPPTHATFEAIGQNGYRVSCPNGHIFEVLCVDGTWTPQLNKSCDTAPTSQETKTASACPQFNPPTYATFEAIGQNGYRVSCPKGGIFEVFCVDGTWTPQLNKSCDTAPASKETKTESSSLSWGQLALYTVPGLFLVLVLALVIIAALVCVNRRKTQKKDVCKMEQQSLDNNSYFTDHRVSRFRPTSGRPLSDVYDELDESRMQDICSPPPLPCATTSSPRTCKTLPKSDKLDPWDACSSQRRSDTLPVNRPLAEPHEYSTPLTRDSTYLVPREQPYNIPPNFYDVIPAKEKR